ncbi:hypothetical protein E2320_021238 [Naja naja]|nr:hypothetical protein E2320_021238 [Naja naja]
MALAAFPARPLLSAGVRSEEDRLRASQQPRKRGKAALILSTSLPLLVRLSPPAPEPLSGSSPASPCSWRAPVAPVSPFEKPAKPSRAEPAGEERRQGGRAEKARRLFEGDRGS